MELSAIIGIITGLLCCGFMALLVIGLAVFLIQRTMKGKAPSPPPAPYAEIRAATPPPPPTPVSAPASQPPVSSASQPAPPTSSVNYASAPVTEAAPAVPRPQPPMPAGPSAPPDPAASVPLARPIVPGPLQPFSEHDEDPTVLARPGDLGLRPTATQADLPDPSASAPWQAPTQRVSPRPAPFGRPVPPPAPSELQPEALRPGATIIPDEDLLDEVDGDRTVLMPRIPRRRSDDEDR